MKPTSLSRDSDRGSRPSPSTRSVNSKVQLALVSTSLGMHPGMGTFDLAISLELLSSMMIIHHAEAGFHLDTVE